MYSYKVPYLNGVVVYKSDEVNLKNYSAEFQASDKVNFKMKNEYIPNLNTSKEIPSKTSNKWDEEIC